VLNETFARFKNHYGFTAAFCNVGKGNEKGNVENKVGCRNVLTVINTIENTSILFPQPPVKKGVI
jgi:transposase